MKKIRLDEMPDIIGPRARIGIGNACAEPQTLVDGLLTHAEHFQQIEIFGMIFSSNRFMKHCNEKRFKLNVFMIDRYTVKGLRKGVVEYIPCRYSQIPKLFLSQVVPLDVALVSVSRPNSKGVCSFGVSSDFTMAMARSAKVVIAEINDKMPWVYGNSFIGTDDIDFYIESDRALPQVHPSLPREVDHKIGRIAADFIEDGATIQIGMGRLSEGILAFLKDKKRLGIHSGLITDGIVDLMEMGVVDNSCKGLKNGRVVTTTMRGTDRLFQFVNRNKDVEAYPSNYTHNQTVLAKLNKLYAINSAIQVDFAGQVNAETVGRTQVSGVGGHTDFVCGAALSRGGQSIILIHSLSGNGARSRIVPFLSRGATVTSLRHDVDYVVTEYGSAYLRGKTLKERAKALISIAHPAFRDRLEAQRRRVYA